eukprot:4964099-Ditylum_brightwellii.AAC.1
MKEGKSLGDSEHDNTGFGNVDEVEILSEDHTVADDAPFNSFYDNFGGDARPPGQEAVFLVSNHNRTDEW